MFNAGDRLNRAGSDEGGGGVRVQDSCQPITTSARWNGGRVLAF